MEPFRVDIPNSVLQDLKRRLGSTRWPGEISDSGWDYGSDRDYVKSLCEYWENEFDWRKQERHINSFSNYIADIDNLTVHFIYERGKGPDPLPIVITHGWPSTFAEMLDIIPMLTDPESHGGSAADSFDVVIPSIPGYGFSQKPELPGMNVAQVASIWTKLMTKELGYESFVAQGGDWGATISNWLGYDHSKSCSGIHLNCLTMRHPDGPQTKEEKDWEERFTKYQIMQEGYRTQQATKPQTLSYAMMDSPVGVAAWILEKFYSWSDIKNNNIESVYSKDILLANIMVYLVSNTFNTSSWIYFGRREEGGRFFPKDFHRIEVPTGVAIFPKEMSEWPPRSYVERIFNIKHWTKMPNGGHFAALEQPELLVNDIRVFAQTLR